VAEASLTSQGDGQYALSGELSFDTVNRLLERSRVIFDGAKEICVDLANVTHSDSAGLALLIEWLRLAKQGDKKLKYRSLPAQLKALASISDVEELLAPVGATHASPS
jgi:phospholipid transport system transporter-binding protein